MPYYLISRTEVSTIEVEAATFREALEEGERLVAFPGQWEKDEVSMMGMLLDDEDDEGEE